MSDYLSVLGTYLRSADGTRFVNTQPLLNALLMKDVVDTARSLNYLGTLKIFVAVTTLNAGFIANHLIVVCELNFV